MDFFLKDKFDKKPDERFIKKKKKWYDFDKPLELDCIPDNIEPGTKEWIHVWKHNPKLQEKMLEYSRYKYVWCERREARISVVICLKKCEEHC
jgi:hypothetical protein